MFPYSHTWPLIIVLALLIYRHRPDPGITNNPNIIIILIFFSALTENPNLPLQWRPLVTRCSLQSQDQGKLQMHVKTLTIHTGHAKQVVSD